MAIKIYDKIKAVAYAKKWALSRNPNYYNFDKLGGDCTNFVSQCLYAGCLIMNYDKNSGWYYNSLNDRVPSWTGVDFLFNFLTKNTSIGPFGKVISIKNIKLGDVVQFGNNKKFYHTVIVTQISNDKIYTSSHTIDSLDRPLESYSFNSIRCIHIEGINT